MKKIFVLLCLAYAANGCAASGRIVATIGALVPLIPGVMYFHDETQRERARVESEMISVEYEDLASNEEFEKRKNEIDSLRPFVVGTFLGVMHPPYNIVIAGL